MSRHDHTSRWAFAIRVLSWIFSLICVFSASSLADMPQPTGASPVLRQASGTVGITQIRVPYPYTEAGASFSDELFTGSDPCTVVTYGLCNVRACPSPMRRGVARVGHPFAGQIHGSAGQESLELTPATPGMIAGTYQSLSLPWSPAEPIRGGEIVRFQAPGDDAGVPAFSGQVIAPVFVTLTTSTSPQITVGTPFTVGWSPSSPNGVVRVGLVSVQPSSRTTVRCDLDGKPGVGTIPAIVMKDLSPGNLVFSVDAVSSTIVRAGAFGA